MKKALIIAAILVFGVINSSVDFPNNHVVNTEVYRVHAGDTFWDINLYFLEYQDEIRALNPELEKSHYQLQPNDLITVQYVTRKE